MVWQKGQSGNPAGPLTAKEQALKRRLHQLTFKAVDALEEALEVGTMGERITAAKEILDRAIGKARQQTVIDVQHSASPHLSALVTLAASTALRVSHVPQNKPEPLMIAGSHTIVHESSTPGEPVNARLDATDPRSLVDEHATDDATEHDHATDDATEHGASQAGNPPGTRDHPEGRIL
jgi:hypothetical protein